jgi:hypothetical protein
LLEGDAIEKHSTQTSLTGYVAISLHRVMFALVAPKYLLFIYRQREQNSFQIYYQKGETGAQN